MQELLSEDLVRPVAWTYLNMLRGTGVLPAEFEGLAIATTGQPIHDLGGQVLFQRVPLTGSDGQAGFADIAVNPALGTPFLAASLGPWSAADVLAQARQQAKDRGISFDDVRIVAYSYPKLAAQFLEAGREVLMLELFTWVPVPVPVPRRAEPPGNFERWSLLESVAERRGQNAERFGAHIHELRTWLAATRREPPHHEGPGAATAHGEAAVLDRRAEFRISSELRQVFPPRLLVRSGIIHYAGGGHSPCYEVRGQDTPVWCVAASTEMVLDFYRYHYQQDRLAAPAELDLGTKAHPNGLPYGQEWRVVNTLELMTKCALTAAENDTPSFGQFVSEIDADRPVISFIPGHSRTVAGYMEVRFPFGSSVFRGLVVYDPWPPGVGTITRYENYASTTYRVSFTAQVASVP